MCDTLTNDPETADAVLEIGRLIRFRVARPLHRQAWDAVLAAKIPDGFEVDFYLMSRHMGQDFLIWSRQPEGGMVVREKSSLDELLKAKVPGTDKLVYFSTAQILGRDEVWIAIKPKDALSAGLAGFIT